MSKPILSLKNVSMHFGGIKAINDISFDVEQGCIFGIIGPNGAGKTTLLKMITGDKMAENGIVQMGNNVKMGYYSQEQERLHPALTVLDETRDTSN